MISDISRLWAFYNLSILSLILLTFKDLEISLTNFNFKNGHLLFKIFFFYSLCFVIYYQVLIRNFLNTSIITPLKNYVCIKQPVSEPILPISTDIPAIKITYQYNNATNNSNTKTNQEDNNKTTANNSEKKSNELEAAGNSIKVLIKTIRKTKTAANLVTKLPKKHLNERRFVKSCRLMLLELLISYRKTRLRPLMESIVWNKDQELSWELIHALSVLISKSIGLDVIKHKEENTPQAILAQCLCISANDYLFNYILCRMEPFNQKEKEFIKNRGFDQVGIDDRDYKRNELIAIEKFMKKNIFMHGQTQIVNSKKFKRSSELRLKYKGLSHKLPILFSIQEAPEEEEEEEEEEKTCCKKTPASFRVSKKFKRTLWNRGKLIYSDNLDKAIQDDKAIQEAKDKVEQVIKDGKEECEEMIRLIEKESVHVYMETNIESYPFCKSIDKEQAALEHLFKRHHAHVAIFVGMKYVLENSELMKQLNTIYYEVFIKIPVRSEFVMKLERNLLELRDLYYTLIKKFDDFQFTLGKYDKKIATIAVKEIEILLPPHPSFFLIEEKTKN